MLKLLDCQGLKCSLKQISAEQPLMQNLVLFFFPKLPQSFQFTDGRMMSSCPFQRAVHFNPNFQFCCFEEFWPWGRFYHLLCSCCSLMSLQITVFALSGLAHASSVIKIPHWRSEGLLVKHLAVQNHANNNNQKCFCFLFDFFFARNVYCVIKGTSALQHSWPMVYCFVF